MKKAVFFMCLSFVFMLSGCVFNANVDTYDENIDMTPRQIQIAEQTPLTEVVASVKGAVVGIMAITNNGYSIGSGVAVGDGGYILTNHHVIEGGNKITIYLADQSTTSGEVLYSDKAMDIAVVKSQKNLPYLVCSKTPLSVGEDVIAIGTPLSLDFKNTVTKGIVSALNRTVGISSLGGYTTYMQNLIQHDASINSGNSGGPLLRTNGEVVGINSLKASDAEGIGFAIPISVGQTVVESLTENKDYSQGYLGVFAVDVEMAKFENKDVLEKTGAYVYSVDENVCSNIKKGDIILQINDTKIKNSLDFRLCIYKLKPGQKANVIVNRDGEIMLLTCDIVNKVWVLLALFFMFSIITLLWKRN